jgi:hypothetical protein
MDSCLEPAAEADIVEQKLWTNFGLISAADDFLKKMYFAARRTMR